METPGLLVVAQIPEVIVPECVEKCVSGTGEYGTSGMACVSTCEELKRRPVQTGDRCGEPSAPCRPTLVPRWVCVTARMRSVARFTHGLHVRVCAIAIRPGNVPRRIRAGRVDGKNVGESLIWNGRVHMRARVRSSKCCMPRVLFAERVERVPRTMRSCWLAQETAQVLCVGDVIGGDLAARMPGKQRTLTRVGNPSEASAGCDAQGDDKAPSIARWKGRTCKLSTAAVAVQKKKKSLAPSARPGRNVVYILYWAQDQ